MLKKEEDFWKINPDYKMLFNNIYSLDKKISSDYMWIVYYYYDTNSILNELNDNEKLNVLIDFFKFPKKDILKLIKDNEELYLKYFESPIKKMLRVWKNKLNEKTNFLESTPYNEETWEMLDKMQSNFVQAYKQYDIIMKDINKDKEQSGQADSELSLSDKGLI